MDEKTQMGVKVDVSVWKAIKIQSIQEGTTAGEIVNQALRAYLGMDTPAPKPTRPAAPAGDPSPDQIEAERIIRENDSMNARQLADLLNEAGHRTTRGAAWSQNTVNKVRLRLRRQGVV